MRSTLRLNELQRSIAFVPQDPGLFNGSLRFNLDPTGEFPDEALFKVLSQVHLSDSSHGTTYYRSEKADVEKDSGTCSFRDLDFQLMNYGTILSLGQRQRLCIARTLLRKNKIVVLDEATASIDLDTTSKIKQVLDGIPATTLVIAHRLDSTMGYDKVLVMDGGQVKEFDQQWTLLQQNDGLFYNLCAASGMFEKLVAVAQAADERESGRENMKVN